jgi:hypothetical protein
MPTIDADAHVIESEETWSYIANEKIRPFLISPGGGRPQNWLVDGRVFNRGVNVDRGLPEAIREMRDIEGGSNTWMSSTSTFKSSIRPCSCVH